MNLEKPDISVLAHSQPEKLFMRSRGRCLCKSSPDRRECLNYEPDKDGKCKHLDKVLWIACLWKGSNHE
jgi:hypothetical protein